jgi:hypothetical protein
MRVEALLEHFWQSRPCEAVRAEMLADWMDILERFSREEIAEACRDWLREGQRKPRPGDIREIILRARATVAAQAPKLPEPPRERVSAERAQEILEAAGINIRRMA